MTPEPLSISDKFSALPEFGHQIQQCVMPIVAIQNGLTEEGKIISLGTGFIVGHTGLMMTAAHVVEDAEALWRQAKPGITYELNALYLTNERHGPESELYLGGLIPITKISHNSALDIACLYLSQMINRRTNEALTYPVMRLDIREPTLHSETLTFGYYEGRTKITDISLGSPAADRFQRTAFSRGKVTELHPDYKYKFPCFTTDAQIEPGMSGSPVMNEEGFACGLISGSLPAFFPEDNHVSYCSMLWPAMGMVVEVADAHARPVKRTLFELAQQGFIQVEGLEDIAIEAKGGGATVVLRAR